MEADGRSEVHLALSIFEDNIDGGPRWNVPMLDLISMISVNTAGKFAHPQCSSPVAIYGPWQSGISAALLRALLARDKTIHAVDRCQPNGSAAVLSHRADDIGGEPVACIVGFERGGLDAQESAAPRADPQISFGIFEQASSQFSSSAVKEFEPPPRAIGAQPKHLSCAGANPD